MQLKRCSIAPVPGDVPSGISFLKPPEQQGLSKGVAPTVAADIPLEAVEAALSRDGGDLPVVTPALPAHPSADGAGVKPPTEESADFPDLETIKAALAIADGRQQMPALPGQPAPAQAEQPPATPPPAPEVPAVPEWQRAIELQAQQTQQQIAMLAQAIQQAFTQPPPPRSEADEIEAMSRDMRVARLDPTNGEHVALYQLWMQNLALQQQFQEQRQYLDQLRQQAHSMTLEAEVGKKVKENLAAFKNLPNETLTHITKLATQFAQTLPHDQAVQQALAGYMPLIRQLNEKAPQVGPAPAAAALPPQPAPVPAFQGRSAQDIESMLRAMSAASVQGRGAGRHNGAPSLEQLEDMIFRH